MIRLLNGDNVDVWIRRLEGKRMRGDERELAENEEMVEEKKIYIGKRKKI